jgi:hypothetical protein
VGNVLERSGGMDQPIFTDVLDRILDKGVMIEAWARISVASIDLITLEGRVVVASIETYFTYAPAVRTTPCVGGPRQRTTRYGAVEVRGDAPPELPPAEAVVRAAEEYLRRLEQDGKRASWDLT